MTFLQGIPLSRAFHEQVIEPTMAERFPALPYASALIGPGSEVLGFDTEMSTDHDWGPRVVLFLREEDRDLTATISRTLAECAPSRFAGYPVDIGRTGITTVPRFIERQLGVRIEQAIHPLDWLTFPSQLLAEIVGGAVFRDDPGELRAARDALQYYPRDVWLYLMASTWNRIGQEEHLAPRAGYAGDELGSALIGARLVHDVMSLCFLIERRYAPYPKWFGTAFRALDCAPRMLPPLQDALSAKTWREREDALCRAYSELARLHNGLGVGERMDEEVSYFFDRPFRVIRGEKFANALGEAIEDPTLRRLRDRRLLGGIDQMTDNTDFRLIHLWARTDGAPGGSVLRSLYDKLLSE